MEHFFLSSKDHLSIERALRRAELLGLGADAKLADAVVAARPSTMLDHGEFWRTVWLFLIANAADIDHSQIGPVIDFIHAVRHERTAVETANGIVIREPPQPQFWLKGRTARSLLRLMREWQRDVGLTTGGLSWAPSRFRPMVLEIPHDDPSAPPMCWELTELTNSEQLRAEGAALRHCVARYTYSCSRGSSRIWSLRRRVGSSVRSLVTVEVDPRRRAIVQARGYWDRPASGAPLRIVRTWAYRENLRLAF